MSKELKKNKLYLLELEYTFEDENGKEETAHDNLVGYVVGKDDDFFFGVNFCMYKGKMTGGDTMHLTLEQFGEWVKSVKEIL